KASRNPSLKRKLAKAKPPTKGYVHRDETIFSRLIESPPEPLQSSFSVSHGMLLNVLSRTYMDGCQAMRDLIRNCHESDVRKERLRRRAFQLFRALVDRKIVSIIPPAERTHL